MFDYAKTLAYTYIHASFIKNYNNIKFNAIYIS